MRPPPPRWSRRCSGTAHAQSGKVLTIAYNVALPSWDPTVGPSAVNPTIQSIYKSVFDSYIDQNPDLVVQARAAHQVGLEQGQDQGA